MAAFTAIRIARVRPRLSVLPGVTTTPRTTVTDTRTPIAPIVVATSTLPFAVFGVWKPISLQPPPGRHDPSSIFTLENGAGNSGPFSIALDSYDGTYLSI